MNVFLPQRWFQKLNESCLWKMFWLEARKASSKCNFLSKAIKNFSIRNKRAENRDEAGRVWLMKGNFLKFLFFKKFKLNFKAVTEWEIWDFLSLAITGFEPFYVRHPSNVSARCLSVLLPLAKCSFTKKGIVIRDFVPCFFHIQQKDY